MEECEQYVVKTSLLIKKEGAIEHACRTHLVRQRLSLRKLVGTHKEYDRINPETV